MTITQEKAQEKAQRPSMVVFTIIWFTQLISLIGSSLTGFGLGIWIFQNTGSVTQYALITLCATLPPIVLSPIAGSLIDRWPKRWMLILTDTGNGLCTVGIAILFLTGNLELWHIYVSTAIGASLNAFQGPAYRVASTLLIPQEHLSRANSMSQIGGSAVQLISPLLAGLLLVTIGLKGIVLIDLATFSLAFLTLIFISFPEIEVKSDKKVDIGSLLKEFAFGWNYVATRPGLLGLLLLFAVSNFFMGFVSVLITPLVLPLFSPAVLGTIESIGGIGALLGSLLMMLWQEPQGKPQFHINAIFGAFIVMGLCIIGAGWNNSFWGLAIINFLFLFCSPIISICDSVIWQKKVPLDIQGRIFALKQMVLISCIPLAASIAGPINEYVFEPLMSDNGLLDRSIGQFINIIPGRGINLLFMFAGAFVILVTIIAYQYPRLRLIEEEIPDVIFNYHQESETLTN